LLISLLDDLLGCDCEGQKINDIEASDGSGAPSPVKVDGPDSEDEEESRGFVTASQYDPKPVGRFTTFDLGEPLICIDGKNAQEGTYTLLGNRLEQHADLQSEQAKADKLSSLKKWHHIDGTKRESFDRTKDIVLHSLVYSDWEDAKFAAAAPAPVDPESIESRDASDDEFDGIESASDKDGDNGYDAEGDPIPSKKRKKATSSSSSARSRKSQRAKLTALFDDSMTTIRKHDLKEIAQGGGGGRVMYIFEKVKEAKM
jgi:DNA repair and recombination protein RAD54B